MKDRVKEIYYGEVEYKYLPGSDGHGKFKGGFVYIFTNAFDVLDCIPKLKDAFNELNLEIISVSFLAIYDNIPWEYEDAQKRYDKLAEEAKTTDEFIFDDFWAYEED